MNLSGNLQLIDGQTIDLSNLQRYVLTTQNDVNRSKVELVKSYLNHLHVTPPCFAV
jgi:molybdopterin/thiamine biosynthesis adenylyltransferase